MYENFITPEAKKGLLYGSLIAAALSGLKGRGGVLSRVARGVGGGAAAYTGGAEGFGEIRKAQTEEDRMRELIESSRASTGLAGKQFGLEQEKWGTMQPYYTSETEYNKGLAEASRAKLIKEATDRESLSKALEAAMPTPRTELLTPLREGEGYKKKPVANIEPLTKEMATQYPESTTTQYLMGLKDKSANLSYVGVSDDKDSAPVVFNPDDGGTYKNVGGKLQPYAGQVKSKVEKTITQPITSKEERTRLYMSMYKTMLTAIASEHRLNVTPLGEIDFTSIPEENKAAIKQIYDAKIWLDDKLEGQGEGRPMGTVKGKAAVPAPTNEPTATNAKGEKQVYRDGRWQPLKKTK